MTYLRILTTTSALALAATPALADLTADEVWADWQGLFENYGAELSTEGQDMSGGTLSVSGITASFDVDGGTMTMDLGDIAFAEQGDGSVVISMAEVMPVTMDITDPEGKEGKVGFTITMPGARLVASGDTVDTRYDFDYPTIAMTDLTVEGDDVPPDMPMNFTLTGSDITGFIDLSGTDVRSYETESNVGSFAMAMDVDDPEQGTGRVIFNMANLAQTASGTFPAIEMDMSLSELIQAGLRQTGIGSYGATAFEFAFDGPDGALDMAGSADGGTIEMSFDENGLSYGGVTRGIAMTLSGDSIPFPQVAFAMEETEGRIVMPVVPGEDPQDFGLVMTMVGLTVDDMIWNMIDPGEQLPRDPATLKIDLSGSAVVTEDYTSPDYAENPGTPPGTLESIDINAVQLSLAGAELTGEGDFAFDNSMGMPMPSGTANIMLTGGNALLDTLVGMGLVPEDQAMGARMMLGLFARPGDGPDTLVSTIEVNEDGSILANGQRIK